MWYEVIPFNSDGHCHENGGCERDVGEGVNDVGEQVSEDVGVCAEPEESVVDTTENDVHHVERRQGQEEAVKQVSDVFPRQDDNGQKVSQEANGADDADEDAIAPKGRLGNVVASAAGWQCRQSYKRSTWFTINTRPGVVLMEQN